MYILLEILLSIIIYSFIISKYLDMLHDISDYLFALKIMLSNL